MHVVRTPDEIAEERRRTLQRREAERARIVDKTQIVMRGLNSNDVCNGERGESTVASTPQEDVGVQSSVCFPFGCLLRRTTTSYSRVSETRSCTTPAPEFTPVDLKKRFVGSSKGDVASSRLRSAASSIETRTSELEERALAARAAAKEGHKSGSRTLALRHLKRAKQIEGQISALQNAQLAVERQADVLEDAGLQQEVAAALTVSAATVKKSQSTLSKVEKAVDGIQEVQEIGADVQMTLGQLSAFGVDEAFDEDELMAELEQEMASPVAVSLAAQEVDDSSAVARKVDLSFPDAPSSLPTSNVGEEQVSQVVVASS